LGVTISTFEPLPMYDMQHRHAMVALWTMGRSSSHLRLLTALAHERSLSVSPWPLDREGATAMPARQGRWWLTQDSEQVVIHATPHHIYALIADLPRMGEWSPECERVAWEGGATGPAEGARFVGHNRGGPFQWCRWSRHGRVLTADPGREFAFVTEAGGPRVARVALSVRPGPRRHPGPRVLRGAVAPRLGPAHRRARQPAPRAASSDAAHAREAEDRRRGSDGLGQPAMTLDVAPGGDVLDPRAAEPRWCAGGLLLWCAKILSSRCWTPFCLNATIYPNDNPCCGRAPC